MFVSLKYPWQLLTYLYIYISIYIYTSLKIKCQLDSRIVQADGELLKYNNEKIE